MVERHATFQKAGQIAHLGKRPVLRPKRLHRLAYQFGAPPARHGIATEVKTVATGTGNLTRPPPKQEVDHRQHLVLAQDPQDIPRAWQLLRAGTAPHSHWPGRPRLATNAQGFVKPSGRVYQRPDPVIMDVQVVNRNRPRRMFHQDRLAMDTPDPAGNLGSVRNGGREANQLDVRRTIQDCLFPSRAPVRVGKEVDLVKDHHGGVAERLRAPQHHVAEDFGGHHKDVTRGILGDIAGQQANGIPVRRPPVVELLVRKRLDWRRVDRPHALASRKFNAELGNHRLARARRRSNQHRPIRTQRLHCL